MIDWPIKVRELRQMAEELEQWSTRLHGRGRLVLGRMADELRQFATQIDLLLRDATSPQAPPEPPPDWLYDLPDLGTMSMTGNGDADDVYEQDESDAWTDQL